MVIGDIEILWSEYNQSGRNLGDINAFMLCTKTQPCAEYCDSHYIIIMYNPTTASAVNQIHPQSYSRALFLSPHTVHMSCYRWLLLHCHRKVHKTDWQAINTWPSSSSAAPRSSGWSRGGVKYNSQLNDPLHSFHSGSVVDIFYAVIIYFY